MTNKITIAIKFDQAYVTVAGFDFGALTYVTQVNPHMDFKATDEVEIIFPEHVLAMSASFANGFLQNMTNNSIKREFALNQVEFVAQPGVKKILYHCLTHM